MRVGKLRVPTVVGRERELASVAACLAPGRGAVVRAQTGLGRTRFAAALHDHARRLEHAPVWVSATRTLQMVRFGALAAALGASMRAEHLDGVSPLALTAMITALRNHGGGRLTVLIIDDAHHLDDGSVDAALAALNTGAIALVVTVDVSVQLPGALHRLVSDGFAEVVDLLPLGRADVAAIVSQLLDGEPAAATVELLWNWCAGSASTLRAIVDSGLRDGRFHINGGRWWWDESSPFERGALQELIDRRLAALDQPTLDALGTVALAGWLSMADAYHVVDQDALVRLERARFLVASGRGAELVIRVADDLIASAAEERLSMVQRRVFARRISDVLAPPSTADELARFARLQVHADDMPSPQLMVEAATMVRLSDRARADRYAQVGYRCAQTVESIVALLLNEVEAGNATVARRYLHEARQIAPNAAEVALLVEAEFAISLFCERDHRGAERVLRSVEPKAPWWQTDSFRSVVALLGAEPDRAGRLARPVLDAHDAPDDVRLRAAVSLVGSTLLAGETAAAQRLADRYLPLAQRCSTKLPTALSMLHAARSFTVLWRGELTALPTADPRAGRWPSPPSQNAKPAEFTWGLMSGIVAHLRGEYTDAVARLREAVVEQSSGKGIFHAEAAAWLVVALCDSGDRIGAEAALAAFPDPCLSVLPGLVDWAAGVVACAKGSSADGARLLARAADAAVASGAPLCEARYLLDLTERCGTDEFVGRLEEVAARLDAPLLVEFCLIAVASRKRDLHTLANHAETLAGYGFAKRAVALGRDIARGARVCGDRDLVGRANHLCRQQTPGKRKRTSTGLSPREAEVVDLAAGGLSDRQIAARLVVSVRTIESHLASAYRKLGVARRTALASATQGDRNV